MTLPFVRYCGLEPNARGVQPGIFALANGLAADGVLGADEHAWWRASNDWCNAAYPTPPRRAYDRVTNPGAVAWFRTRAPEYIFHRIDGYLRLLDRHSVGWERIETDAPGRIVYEDDVQVIACPDCGQADCL